MRERHGTITVCDACGRAECWEGTSYCEKYKTAGTREVTGGSSASRRCLGERERLAHSIARLRGALRSLEIGLGAGGVIGLDAAHAVAHTGVEIACQIARHDAYLFAENDVTT